MSDDDITRNTEAVDRGSEEATELDRAPAEGGDEEVDQPGAQRSTG
jgi:hypothetical protein